MVTDSGREIRIPRHCNRLRKKLEQFQKLLAKKSKGSRNRQKARVKVTRVFETIWNCRRDLLHKLSSQLMRENETVVVEELCIKGMFRSKRYIHSIADASWGEFVRQLEYKSEWYGRELIKIDCLCPSTKTCSSCGYLSPSMSESVCEWQCRDCRALRDRDVNAAKNMLAAGLSVSACGATVRPNSRMRRRQVQ